MSKCCAGKRRSKKPVLLATKRPESKVVLVGDSGVGKSSILMRYLKNEYSEAFEITVGGAFMQAKVPIEEDVVTLDIWDTAGQERFRSLLSIYFRSAIAAVVVYDVTDPESFERCEYWVKTLKEYEPQCQLFIAGNKYDNENSNYEEGLKEYAQLNGVDWVLTSAKNDINIKSLFERVARSVRNSNNIQCS